MIREALKLALHGLEMGVTLIEDFGSKEQLNTQHKAIAAIYEALAQPEQEPVAWMFQHEETGRMMFVEAQQLEWGFEKGNPRLKKIGPVYAIQPKQTWVGLTDEDELDWDGGDLKSLVKAIEAKLKEKNT